MRQLPWVQPGEIAGAARTVAGHLSRGYHLVEIWCHPCHRMIEIGVHDLPLDMRIADICERFHCSECGGHELSSNTSAAEVIAHEIAAQL